MLISRIKQVYQYIFSNFNDNLNNEVKKILSKEEFLIFSEMGNYDKVHSYKLYQKVKSNKVLSLQENYLKMSDFDEMVITIGPGSYTGVRVALTIAKTLNATMNIKVKTVSSLKAMAGMKKAISILDARSHKLFLGIYNEGKVIVDDCLINIDEFENYQKQYSDYEIVGDTHLVGIPEKEVDLADHIYTLSTLEKEIENVDGLVPRYIKEVEAKKICQ